MSLEFIRESERKTPVVEKVDVVIVGGGPAGLVAALAASRNGVDTLLIERFGHLGGMATGGLVITVLPLRDGKKEIIGGITGEIMGNLKDEEWGVLVNDVYGVINIDPEGMKHVANVMLEKSGARVQMHSYAVDAVIERDVVRGVIVESKAGRQAILAKTIIDASGDGDIAVSAGAPFEEGIHPWGISLGVKIVGVDSGKVLSFRKEKPGHWEKLRKEMERKGFVFAFGETTVEGVMLAWLSFKDLNALDPKDLTRVEIEARKKIFDSIRFSRKNVPGFESAYIVDTACQIGVRESRRIVGEYVLTMEDINENRSFDDAIVSGGWPEGWQLDGKKPWIPFSIPYRCLIPKKVENLLVAGRCLSCTHDALDPLRAIPHCMGMGEAAGTAAALAIKVKTSPRKLATKDIQNKLRQQGVIIE